MEQHDAGTEQAIPRFCVTHKQPMLPRSWYDYPIALGKYLPESPFHISKLDPFWDEARPIAYGAAGSYGVPAALSRYPSTAPLIEISTFRKRCLPTALGVDSIGMVPGGGWRDVEIAEAERRTDVARFTPPFGFLFNSPLLVPTTVSFHYADCHHFRDLLDYASLAIELGVLDGRGAQEMLGAKYLIPGGVEMGVFPRTWLVSTLTAIEKVSREFLIRYGERVRTYDDHQIRAVGFLSERLGSYMLLRDVLARFAGMRMADLSSDGCLPLPQEMFGHMTIVLDNGGTYTPGRAEPGDITWR